MEVAEETDIPTMKGLPVPSTQSVVLPESDVTVCASKTDEGTEERLPLLPLIHFQEIVSIYWYTGEISSKMELQEQLKYSNQRIEKSQSIVILFNGIQYKSPEYKCVSLLRLFWNEQFYLQTKSFFSDLNFLNILLYMNLHVSIANH